MKYNRMVWLTKDDGNYSEKLKSLANNQFPFIFTDSIIEFEKMIKKDDYLVISILRVKENLNGITNLLRNHPKLTFHFLGHLAEDGYTYDEFKIFDEENAVSIPYDAEELVLEYTGKIENIFLKRGIPIREH